ncbi:hypothetical protein CsSME_00010913 [Camellia sinensis var. sinensis]
MKRVNRATMVNIQKSGQTSTLMDHDHCGCSPHHTDF